MNFRDINIGKRLGINAVIVSVLTLSLAYAAYQAIDRLSEEWQDFRSSSFEQFVAVSQGNVKLGDAIQHFKNYLLRGKDYQQKFLADLEGIEQAMQKYTDASPGLSEAEQKSLSAIEDGANAYRAAMQQAVQMKNAGATIEEIDRSIKGADKPLAQALDELQAVTLEKTEASGQFIYDTADRGKKTVIIVTLLVVGISGILSWLMAVSIVRPLRQAVKVADAVAGGDLTQQVDVRSRDEFGHLLQALKTMNANLSGIVADVRNSTDSITTASQEIAQGNIDLSQRTEEQASSLEQTASSMEQLTATVRQNTGSAVQANQLAIKASDIAIKGGQAVDEVVHTMVSISESSRKIVDIISVIEGIAFQTNILALNAAVEAARAGEQGRGFAVVAGEVRNLAQRSAAAAKEIKALIDNSVSKVETGSQQVDFAGSTMSEIVAAVKRVTDIMTEISAASQEQEAGIEQVNQAISQMSETTQQNTALVEETSAAAESMRERAIVLSDSVSVFKLEAGAEASASSSVHLRSPEEAGAARAHPGHGHRRLPGARPAGHTHTGRHARLPDMRQRA